MNKFSSCPKCGNQIPPEAPAGQCPRCLLQMGLDPSGPVEVAATIDSDTSQSAAAGHPAPQPHELAGSFPQYEILELVGQGGMGAVYRAEQRSLGRVVALKVIKPDLADSSDFAERFAREARAMARLNHPNIVSVYDFGESDGMFFFTMEHVDGTDLRQLMAGGTLTPAQALQIVPQICEALQYAHDEGIVHRDIKPENILVDRRGRVRIADFGLAKLTHGATQQRNLTGTYQVMGTPKYMAPEQMEGAQQVDHRADIYSLGVVFYELLTGELPLGRFVAPSEKAPIDGRLDEVVMRALEKELPKRYQQASEFKSEVERVSSHDNVGPENTPPSPPPPPRSPASQGRSRSMKRHITILGVIHMAFGALLACAAIALFVILNTIGIASGDKEAMKVLPWVATGLGGFLGLLSVPGIVAGYGLLTYQSWARFLALVLAVLSLANIPFGTAISIYTFWVLLHEDTVQLMSDHERHDPGPY